MSRKRTSTALAVGILIGATLVPTSHAAAQYFTARHSAQKFFVDGKQVELEAYAINGCNYVKIGDLSALLGFELAYDGVTNSVYIGERPVTPQGTGDGFLTNGKPATEENVLEMLRQIEQEWPTNTVWGTRHTPGTHKNEVLSTEGERIMLRYGVSNVYGCGAYASMVSSLIFGDETNPTRRLEDLNQIRPGDIIFRVNNDTGKVWHVTVALESPNSINEFHVTDGNHGGTVQWPDREKPYGRDNLNCYRGEGKSYHLEAWTRYPENVPYTGNSIMGWPTRSGK